MPHSFGYRAGTRYSFARNYRQHGTLPTTTYLRTFKLGQHVDIVVNGAVHKGMPHKTYQGKTGVVWNITPRAVGVELNKRVGHRIIKKRIHARIEHVRPSKCRDDFLRRVGDNEKKKQEYKEAVKDPNKAGKVTKPVLKRQPAQPTPAHWVPLPKGRKVETITPIRYLLMK